MKKVNQGEFITRLTEMRCRESEATTALMVKTVTAAMRHSIADGERIEIRGFGTFVTRVGRSQRRNPKTGEKLGEAEATRVRFKPSPNLVKQLTNKLNKI